MKKLLMVAALFIAANCVKAQDSKLSFGVRAGLNISNTPASGNVGGINVSVTPDSKVGFNIGGFAEYAISPSFAIQPGLEFTTKGAKLNSKTILGVNSSATGNLEYLEMPIMAVYKFPITQGLNLSVNVGPYLAYGIGGNITYADGTASVKSFDSSTNKFDFGLGGGLGLEYNKILFNVGYERGLTNLEKNATDVTEKNTNFKITLGYRF